MNVNPNIVVLAIFALIIAGCQPNKKSNARFVHAEQNVTKEHSVEHNDRDKKENRKDKLSQDSIYMILYGTNSLPDSIGSRLPTNAKDYFSKLNFPYKFQKDLSINYYCNKEDFYIEDLFIFKTKNNYRTCEYIALIDTFPFIEIIAKNCNEMENWIALYVLNEKYEVIDSELLLLPLVHEADIVSLKYENQTVRLIDVTDTLTYSNQQYKVFSDEVFEITDDSGKNKKDIGSRKLKMFTVSEIGKIIQQCDSVIYQKEYYEKFWKKRERSTNI